MSLVTEAEVRGFLPDTARLAALDLQGLIDREESYLAHRVGPLVGARVDVVWPTQLDRPVRLRRPTTAVTVTDAGVAVAGSAIRLLDERVVEYIDRCWIGPVALTSTPNDELDVRAVIFELIRTTVTNTAFDSESMGDYTYSRGNRTLSRGALWRSLLPKPGLSSVAIG